MNPLPDDFMEDAFHEALLKLKMAVSEELGDDMAVITMARWTGRRPNTVYGWLAQTSRPSDYKDVLRLILGATQAGYGHFTDWFTGGAYRLTPNAPVFTNHTLDDEAKRNQLVWGRLRAAEDAHDGHAVIECGREHIAIGESVIAEGQNMLTSPAAYRAAIRPAAQATGDGAHGVPRL